MGEKLAAKVVRDDSEADQDYASNERVISEELEDSDRLEGRAS
jgi:hypothetical protein